MCPALEMFLVTKGATTMADATIGITDAGIGIMAMGMIDAGIGIMAMLSAGGA